MKPVIVYIGNDLAAYGFGDGHPFGRDRMDAFWEEAKRRGLDRKVKVCAPVRASLAAILRFHAPEYVRRVRRLSATGEGLLDGGDTPAFRGMFEAAAAVAGSAIDAADRLMRGEAKRAFVPIGGLHHAQRSGAAGFCIFNDCGIVIEHLKQEYRLKRIAYIDIDAHHGDGVFYAYEGDSSVWIADIHEDGRFLYPGTGFASERGRGHAVGTKLNLPLPPGADDAAFLRAWVQVEAHLSRAEPAFIILQCGADSLAGDPIAHLRLSPQAHAHATERLCRLADVHCGGRLLVLGGGGYNRTNLAVAWSMVLQQLATS